MYCRKNRQCDECKIPFRIVWNCKKTSSDKEWILLCYNCITYFKHINRWSFKTRLQNINGFRWCKQKLSKTSLPLYEVN